MIGKLLRKIIGKLLLIFCILKNCEKNNSVNDSKLRKRRMALSCSKTTICIIKRNNTKTSW